MTGSPEYSLANLVHQGYKCTNMNARQPTLGIDPTRLLWERLASDLGKIFDAHGVCAAASFAIATSTDTLTLVSISDPDRNHYDVWICDSNGKIDQDRWPGKEAAFNRIVQANGPELYEKLEAPPRERIRSELWQLASDSILAVPLPFPTTPGQITTPGAICLVDPPKVCPVNKRTIGPIAIQISAFLERALLRQRSDQQEVEFGIMSEISTSLTSTLHLDEIIVQVTDAVRRVLGAESLTIGLTEPNRREIVFVEALMGPSFNDMPPASFQIGQGIAGWVALHGEPAIVNDAYADHRFSSKVDRDTGFLTNSVLCVPLKAEQQTIGVLEALNKQNGKFDENDSRLLQAISGPLAIAIENALLHSDVLSEKRRIETIFASMSDGLMTTNAKGDITAANDALISLLDVGDTVITGEAVATAIKMQPDDFSEFFNQVLQDGREFPQLAGNLLRKNGEYAPVLISGTKIDKEDGSVDEVIFVFSDLGQIREVERMRDDFFNNIVHELRTPLATILMYARLLKEGKAIDDPTRANRFLGVIERESDRLQKMVRQMLQLAKLESDTRQRQSESTNINLLLEQILPPLADRAREKGLIFKEVVQPRLPAVKGSEDTHYMIIKNLVENGIKFTPTGSVSVEAWLQKSSVLVEITDEGIGIPKEALPNLFQRFYRTKSAVERGIAGTGLGLYMVKEGLETIGGAIEVSSQEGKGTRFTVSLPIADD